jgi:hypothetical protein
VGLLKFMIIMKMEARGLWKEEKELEDKAEEKTLEEKANSVDNL